MTNEQREAVDNIKIFVKSIRSDLAEESEDNQELADALDTDLSLIKQKDKQIDLYIDELICNEFDRCCQECCRECEKDKDTLKDCIKQYFERKAR